MSNLADAASGVTSFSGAIKPQPQPETVVVHTDSVSSSASAADEADEEFETLAAMEPPQHYAPDEIHVGVDLPAISLPPLATALGPRPVPVAPDHGELDRVYVLIDESRTLNRELIETIAAMEHARATIIRMCRHRRNLTNRVIDPEVSQAFDDELQSLLSRDRGLRMRRLDLLDDLRDTQHRIDEFLNTVWRETSPTK